MAKCSECGGYVDCPGHKHASLFPYETPVLQCKPTCSLWARVSDNRGRPVKGIQVNDGTTTIGSKSNGFAAFEDKASLKNEQTHIGMENDHGKVFFKQIAGFVARRIVADLKVGDSMERGKRFGMIKFGSRVDIYVPKHAEIKVSLNQKTVAGETVIAEWK